MLRPNFDKTVTKQGDVLTVRGPSDSDEDMQLVSRHVALQQPPTTSDKTQYIAGESSKGSKWSAVLKCSEDPLAFPPRPKPKFTKGPVLATGVETYFVGHPDRPNVPATFITVTWSEVVEIKGS